MRRRLFFVSFWTLLLPLSVFARQEAAPVTAAAPVSVRTNVVLDSNETLFTVLAAAHVGGVPGAPTQAPAAGILARLRAAHLPITAQLEQFCAAHRQSNSQADLAQYVSLALLLGDPPNFNLQVAPADMPADAAGVRGFIPLLRQFYQQADIADLWFSLEKSNRQAVDAYSPKVRRIVERIDAYFRLPQVYLGRQMFIYPDLLASSRQADARSFLGSYFIVVNPNSPAEVKDVQHTYLHYVLDPLVEKYAGAYRRLQPIMEQLRRAPALAPPFKSSARLLMTECLVRAVELRLSHATAAQQLQAVQADAASGLVLTPYFYNQLGAYQKDVVTFSEFYPKSAWTIDENVLKGQVRHMVFSAAPVSTEPLQAGRLRSAAPQGLLEQGQAAMAANNWTGLQALATAALKSPSGDHATAHYLLAEMAARQRQPELAFSYFQRALAEAAPAQRHVRTWANIYLARIYDLQGERPAALRHYQAALSTAQSPGAREIANDGLQHPFHTNLPHNVKQP